MPEQLERRHIRSINFEMLLVVSFDQQGEGIEVVLPRTSGWNRELSSETRGPAANRLPAFAQTARLAVRTLNKCCNPAAARA